MDSDKDVLVCIHHYQSNFQTPAVAVVASALSEWQARTRMSWEGLKFQVIMNLSLPRTSVKHCNWGITGWNRRCAGLNMNPTALEQVLWTTGKMVPVWRLTGEAALFCDHTQHVLPTRYINSEFDHWTLCGMPGVFCCSQRKWIVYHLKKQ